MTLQEIQAAVNADPEIQRLVRTANGQTQRGSPGAGAQQALQTYLRTRRPDLQAALDQLAKTDPGIGRHSTGFGIDLRTGQLAEYTGTDPWVIAATGAAMAAGGYALGGVLGGAAPTAAAGGSGAVPLASTSVPGTLASTSVPVSASMAGPSTGALVSQGVSAPAFGSAPALASGPAAAAARSITDKLTDPRSLAALSALGLGGVRSLLSGNDGPLEDDALGDEMKAALAAQRARMEQSQPAFDTLVRMSYGMSPTAYRGEAPAGYTAPATDNPAYAYQAPSFGGRR